MNLETIFSVLFFSIQMPLPLDETQINRDSYLIVQEGLRRGYKIEVVGQYSEKKFRVEKNGKGFLFHIIPGHATSMKDARYKDWERKDKCIEIMREFGLPVPQTIGTFENVESISFSKVSFPVVAKPLYGFRAQNVFVDIRSASELKSACQEIFQSGDKVLVEQYVLGRNYRILFIDQQYIGTVERMPANVLGDGIHAIKELIAIRNQEPGREDQDAEGTTLHKIVVDEVTDRLLDQQKYTLDEIPSLGQFVQLQEKIAAKYGTDLIDVTTQVHPEIIQKCQEFCKYHDIPYIGFDFISPDLTKNFSESNAAFNEFNFPWVPAICLNEENNFGIKREPSKAIWEMVERREQEIITKEFLEY